MAYLDNGAGAVGDGQGGGLCDGVLLLVDSHNGGLRAVRGVLGDNLGGGGGMLPGLGLSLGLLVLPLVGLGLLMLPLIGLGLGLVLPLVGLGVLVLAPAGGGGRRLVLPLVLVVLGLVVVVLPALVGGHVVGRRGGVGRRSGRLFPAVALVVVALVVVVLPALVAVDGVRGVGVGRGVVLLLRGGVDAAGGGKAGQGDKSCDGGTHFD